MATITTDNAINHNIHSLECTESAFVARLKQRSKFVDFERTSFAARVIFFKDGFARKEYFAHKKLLEETARVFRDFPELEKIKIIIESHYEKKLYKCRIRREDLEDFMGVKFAQLHQNIKDWRIFLGSIDKNEVNDFAKNHIKYYRVR